MVPSPVAEGGRATSVTLCDDVEDAESQAAHTTWAGAERNGETVPSTAPGLAVDVATPWLARTATALLVDPSTAQAHPSPSATSHGDAQHPSMARL